MKLISAFFAVIAMTISGAAFAFMPSIGLWNFEAELNGLPGRGMMIEVRNDQLFLTYFGYRADGSSVKYNASGPLSNNSFVGDLVEYQGGPVLGSPYQPATLRGTIGTVSIMFTSGTYGTIALPGESTKAIVKNALWLPNNQDGLLGNWHSSIWIGGTVYTLGRNFNTKLGATSTGNGIVTNSAANIGCEYQVSGAMAGMVFCVEVPIVTGAYAFVFKFSGDVGDGVGYYYTSKTTLSSAYESRFRRIQNVSGTRTGLNNNSSSSLQAKSADTSRLSNVIQFPTADEANTGSPQIESDPAKAGALAAWAIEVATVFPHQ